MRSEILETILLCGIAVCSMVSLGWITLEDLRLAATVLIAWSVASTLLVGSAGACVAYARSQRARAARVETR